MQACKQEAEALVCAAIGYVELRAAIAATIRDRRIPPRRREHLRQELEALWEEVLEVPMDRPLIRQAGDVAERVGLRGYDAVHLAALLTVGSPKDVAIATWDEALKMAAIRNDYPVIAGSTLKRPST